MNAPRASVIEATEVAALPGDLPFFVYDAVIVGAGLAGSGMAAGLAGQGWRVLVVERDHLPRHKVCGEFLSPEAQKSLRGLGLYEVVAALNPVALAGAALTTNAGRQLTVPVPGQAWGISRFALDAALARGAEQQGATVWCGTTVIGWHAIDSGMVVQVRKRTNATVGKEVQGEIVAVQARALVVACGRSGLATLVPRASARQGEKRGDKGARKANVGVKCHYIDVAMPAQVELYLFGGGYVGINPVEGGAVNVCALASYAAFGRAGRSPHALFEAAATWNPAFGERLRHAQALPATACAVAPVDTQRAANPWDDLPLLGDTAAMIPPLCGDGMAMALRSAELCVPLVDAFLRGQMSWERVGKRYRQVWHGEFDGRLAAGRLLERLLLGAQSAELLFMAGARFPVLADYFMRATRGG